MNRRMVLYVTGRVTFVVGLLMILPIIVAFIYHEGHETIYPLFQAMVCTLAVGAAMAARPPKRRSIYVREGLAITGLSWILLVIFGSLPYLFTGAIPSVVDAIFESASGLQPPVPAFSQILNRCRTPFCSGAISPIFSAAWGCSCLQWHSCQNPTAKTSTF